MTIRHVIISVTALLLVISTSLAQENGKPTPHGFKLDFKLPTATSNKSFKGVMSGLIDADFCYQYQFKKIGLFLNGGLKYSYWNLESARFSGTLITGKLEILQPFIGIGYKHNFSEKVFLESELKTGYSLVSTNSSTRNGNYKQQAIAFEPKLGLFYKTSDFLSFGLTFNYNIIQASFTPDNIAQANFPGFAPEASKGIYQYFSVGFGFYATLPTFK